MATRAELIGADLAVDEIRDFVGADSLRGREPGAPRVGRGPIDRSGPVD